MKRFHTLALTLSLATTLVAVTVASSRANAGTAELQEIETILFNHTRGGDPALASKVAPAQSLNTRAAKAVRVAEINTRLLRELDGISTAFETAPDADKTRATRSAAKSFDKETAAEGASRTFEGNGPALSVMRQLLFVPVTAKLGADPVARVAEIVSSFERSPKPEDYYYEYGDAAELRKNKVVERKGGPATYRKDARPPMTVGDAYALKKCRYVFFSWYCNTSLYSVFKLAASAPDSEAYLLTTDLYDLGRNADNGLFKGDGRTKNIVEGYTALYLIKRSGSLILVYSLGVQHTSDAPKFQGRLNEGHKLEYKQLLERMQDEVGAKLP